MISKLTSATNKILLPVLMTVLTAGCASDEPRPSGRSSLPVEFTDIFVERGTRSELTTGNLQEFRVFGFVDNPPSPLFNGALVSRSGDKWVTARPEYWYPSHSYYFSGIAPADEESGWTFTPTTDSGAPYYGGGTLEFDFRKQYGDADLIYAFSGRIDTPSALSAMPPVELVFRHLLSKVRFVIFNDLKNSHYLINVSLIQLQEICGKATIDLNKPEPRWQQKDYTTSWLNIPGGLARTDMPVTSPDRFLIPVSLPQTKIAIQTQVFFNPNETGTEGHVFSELHTLTAEMPEVDFKPGYTYEFIARLTPGNVLGDGGKLSPIIFTVHESYMWDSNIDTDL